MNTQDTAATYATVGRLKLVPIEGSKNLQIGFHNGLPYAVSKEANENDLYLIFLPDGQISEEYATIHDLVQRVDEKGNRAGGFFGTNRKVRTVKFMQGKIRSVGYVAPLNTLIPLGIDISNLKEGDSFNEINNIKICNKFINTATKKAINNANRFKNAKRQFIGMPEHADTKQIYNNYHNINVGDKVIITEKLDGTSNRFAYAYNRIVIGRFKSLLLRLIGLKDVARYKILNISGSRRVIIDKNSANDTSYYSDKSIYTETSENISGLLHPGEAIYGEIVGWISPERAMFDRGGVKFVYGTKPGERQFYVYNIKWTLLDGSERDLSWEEIKIRCAQLGLKHVPELAVINIENQNRLDKLINITIPELTVGKSTLDSHIREGVVVRVENGFGTHFYKSKSEEFYGLEDKFKNDDSNIDIEEAS